MSQKKQIPIEQINHPVEGLYLAPLSLGKPAGHVVETGPHRHDFYCCVLLERGEMEFEVDFQSIKLKDHTLFFSYPGQIHNIRTSRPERGWFLAIDPNLLDAQLKGILEERLQEVILLPLAQAYITDFSAEINRIAQIYNNAGQVFGSQIIRSLINAFIYQLAAMQLKMEYSEVKNYSIRSVEITKQFKKSLHERFKSHKTPSAFAAQMNVTVTYLNDTVRSVTGFTLTYFIQQEMVREARRLLYYSDLSIKLIAVHLGYDDALYFSRLFRKVTGDTPSNFRKRLLQ